MIAYNSGELDKQEIREEVQSAYRQGLITETAYKDINTSYPEYFYSPNIFIRIGLFILTLIIAIFGLGLLLLMGAVDSERGIRGFSVFIAVVAYAACEMMIHGKKHYKSGVDTASMWMCGAALCTFYFMMDLVDTGTSLYAFLFVVSAYFTLRFADVPMAIIAYGSLMMVIFVNLDNSGARAFLPFVIMLLSIGAYFGIKALARKTIARHYKYCLTFLEICALLTLYMSMNYFVVNELNNEYDPAGSYIDDPYPEGTPVPPPAKPLALAWLFWTTTIALPLLYIYFGLRKKDRILLGTGLLLLAAATFTVRYYHSIMPLEGAMVLAGIIMITIAWSVIRYLKVPKHGFTNEEDDEKGAIEKLHLESLVITQTMGQQQQVETTKGYGGGSGIGGGASGDF